jgi:NhaP-type Na+/H+ or K+/H+ antiporter
MLGDAGLPQVLPHVVLGLLLFAASLHVDLTELRRQKWAVLVLATASVIIATIVFGVGNRPLPTAKVGFSIAARVEPRLVTSSFSLLRFG